MRNHIFTAELAGGLAATIIFLLVARVTVRSVAETSDAVTRTYALKARLDRLQTLVAIEKSEGTTQEFGLGIDPEATTTRMPPMDEMRAVVAGMDAREDRLLAIQMERAGRSYREAFLVGLLGTGLTAVAAIACFFELGVE